MEMKMETTVVFWGLYGDKGKENGNYQSIVGLYRDKEKEHGNYSSIFGLYRDNGHENGDYSAKQIYGSAA